MSAGYRLPSPSSTSDEDINYRDYNSEDEEADEDYQVNEDTSQDEQDNSAYEDLDYENEEADLDYQDDEDASEDEQDDVHHPDDTINILEPFCLIVLNHFQNFQHSGFCNASAYIVRFPRIVVEYVVQHGHGLINVLVRFYNVHVQPHFQFRIPQNLVLEQRAVHAVRIGFRGGLRGVLAIVGWYRYMVRGVARNVWQEHCMRILAVGLVCIWFLAGFGGMLVALGGFILVTAMLGWWDLTGTVDVQVCIGGR